MRAGLRDRGVCWASIKGDVSAPTAVRIPFLVGRPVEAVS